MARIRVFRDGSYEGYVDTSHDACQLYHQDYARGLELYRLPNHRWVFVETQQHDVEETGELSTDEEAFTYLVNQRLEIPKELERFHGLNLLDPPPPPEVMPKNSKVQVWDGEKRNGTVLLDDAVWRWGEEADSLYGFADGRWVNVDQTDGNPDGTWKASFYTDAEAYKLLKAYNAEVPPQLEYLTGEVQRAIDAGVFLEYVRRNPGKGCKRAFPSFRDSETLDHYDSCPLLEWVDAELFYYLDDNTPETGRWIISLQQGHREVDFPFPEQYEEIPACNAARKLLDSDVQLGVDDLIWLNQLAGKKPASEAEPETEESADEYPPASSVEAEPPQPAPSDTESLSTLKAWAATELKGKQRQVIEIVAQAGGEKPIADIALSPGVDWETPFDGAFSGLQKAVNPKLKKHRPAYRLERRDGCAHLKQLGQK